MLVRSSIRISTIFFLLYCMAGCVESSFELAPESRLPDWFSEPDELTRSDLTVTMDYHTDGDAVFTLYHKDKYFRLQKVIGTSHGNRPITLKDPPPGFPKGYPLYQIITVGDKTEVIEHRKLEPVFYITDDPNILKELGVEK